MPTPKTKKADQPRRLELVPLSELKRAKRNPKDHDLGALAASFKRFGVVAPVVIDERTGRLVAGHGRLDLLVRLEAQGEPPPPGVEVRAGEWCVPVARGWASKDDAQAEAYLVADNRVGELGGWQEDQLQELLTDLEKSGQLEGTGYDSEDLADLVQRLEGGPGFKTDGEDEVPETPAKPWVKDGELYELGQHLLIVGDSFEAAVRERLFAAAGVKVADAAVTDPPYAIYGSSTGLASDIADDKMVQPFFAAVMAAIVERVKSFGHAYLFNDWRSWAAMWHAAGRAGLPVKGQQVWDKGDGGIGSNWQQCHELVMYLAKIPPQKHMKRGDEVGQRVVLGKGSILRAPRPVGEERQHNAAKPVSIVRTLVEAATDAGEVVFEPFTGGGSTLIACEQLGRRACCIELEPKHAQVAIERWQRFTGKEARKLTGKPPRECITCGYAPCMCDQQ